MIKLIVEFGVGTSIMGSDRIEQVEIEVYPEDDMEGQALEEFIQEEICDEYAEWVADKTEEWSKELKREIIEELE
ncbi:MAG: hypothetical protein PF569_06515 [Candidatus Woesearchaeota archaeon]|jgi:hypothetical protein|nr:hypothetical protein [Candidatus Woesearchaeota archaeon]